MQISRGEMTRNRGAQASVWIRGSLNVTATPPNSRANQKRALTPGNSWANQTHIKQTTPASDLYITQFYINLHKNTCDRKRFVYSIYCIKHGLSCRSHNPRSPSATHPFLGRIQPNIEPTIRYLLAPRLPFQCTNSLPKLNDILESTKTANNDDYYEEGDSNDDDDDNDDNSDFDNLDVSSGPSSEGDQLSREQKLNHMVRAFQNTKWKFRDFILAWAGKDGNKNIRVRHRTYYKQKQCWRTPHMVYLKQPNQNQSPG
ncbi:hypothetical protein K469DRAFT_762329 [Zopfia rhizophila CBS 207.26]|uniref:Uncharacterized protein n=1 Tax=Zopfia rhizophila CBS 207.26 TaxID=1314779 RepID=A0A6A6ED10_9PEZI|nr:hypothetical protein K469DRAFT_762329 [Zopfia rhizophila CBS 207.26]